jgi:hypothetical protein
MRKWLILLFLLIAIAAFPLGTVFAQNYYFQLVENQVHVFWNEDGTSSIDYVFVFTNDSSASPIDYVDVGLPNRNFDSSSIYADVDGQPVANISASDYQGLGDSGVAIGLGSLSIKPGETGTVHVFVGTQRDVLYEDDQDNDYASAVFIPTYFGSEFIFGDTNLCVTYHLPPSVQPDEPRWHSAPEGFPSEPETGIDQDGRIYYSWCNPSASGSSAYQFGASFPKQYVPASAIVVPSFWENIGINPEDLIGASCCLGFGLIIFGVIAISVFSTNRRKLQYLSPKIAIEGHGIKRGLTAVEAAILLEQPMDKILTMILFSSIKKNAATVLKQDPLEIEVADPLPDGLHPYEEKFLAAFTEKNKARKRKALQTAMIDLVNSISKKMKGFSRKETVAYYKDIVKRAWAQVEAAETPEIRSEKYSDNIEWTMLDKDYDERTRDVFRTGPVFIPVWWHRYDPGIPRTTPTTVARPTSASPGKSVSLPHLPGSDFAASVVNGVQSMSAGVVGSLTSFTNGVTQKTNPPPVRTSSGRGFSGGSSGGCACACACACAGCACACAGGGR